MPIHRAKVRLANGGRPDKSPLRILVAQRLKNEVSRKPGCGLTIGAHLRPLSFHAAAGCSALLGRGRDFAESQPLDTSEFAKIAVERAEGQVTRFPSNLQNQAV